MPADVALAMALPRPTEELAGASEVVEVVLVGEQGLFRAGLVELLKTVAGCVVLGQAANGRDALAMVRRHHPDVVMLEAELLGAGVSSTISQILRESSRTKVLVLAARDDPDLLRQVVHAGGSGFLSRAAGRAELIAALESARGEQDSFLLAASRTTLSAVLHRSDPTTSPLTAQETRVLGLLAEGQPNRRISVELFISEATVKRHLTNIYRKLGVASRLHAVRKATQMGLLAATSAEVAGERRSQAPRTGRPR